MGYSDDTAEFMAWGSETRVTPIVPLPELCESCEQRAGTQYMTLPLVPTRYWVCDECADIGKEANQRVRENN